MRGAEDERKRNTYCSFCYNIVYLPLFFFVFIFVGDFFIYHGRTRKIIYLLLALSVSITATILLDRKIFVFKKMSQFSARNFWINNKARFHIEKIDIILLFVIVLVGAIIRFAGVNWGITCIFQADERKLVKPALEMAINVWPYDGNMGYPNQLVSKLAAVCIMIYSKITGTELIIDSIYGYFIFRIITAAFSTCTIITAFLIGNYIKKHMGLIVAVFVSVFPEFVGLSKQVTADTTALFFMTLVLIMSLIYLEKARIFPLALMAAFAAMATMEKWHSAVACFYIAIVVMLNCKTIKNFFIHGCTAFIVYVVNLCLIAPNGFWHLNGTIRGLMGMYEYDKDGVRTYMELFRVYTDRLLQYVGVIFLILLIAGIVVVLKEHDRKYVVLLLGIIKLAAICFLNRGFSRWGLEFYFTVLLLASIGVYDLITSHRMTVRYAGSVALILVMICLGSGSLLTMTTAVRSGQDTRLLQDEYCRLHNITEENSAYDDYTAFQPGGLINIKRKIRGTHSTLEDSFVIEDGQMYKKSKSILYAIDNMERCDSDISEVLQQKGSVEKVFDTVGPDVFEGAVNGIEKDYYEWGIIVKNIKQIMRIMRGDSIGPSIIIYDLSNIPVKESI